jgi:hypothetical protein
LISILVYSNSNVFGQNNKWELKKSENGIKVYTRKDKVTGNVEFKAITEIETTIEALIKVFKDVNAYTKWMADTKKSKILKKVDSNKQYIYIEAESPWPFQNRDMILFQKITKTKNGTKIEIIGKPNYIPYKKGITRIEKVIGSWKFIQLQNNKIKIIYQFMADPGLNIPDWVINLFIVDGPYKTLMNLKSIVEL